MTARTTRCISTTPVSRLANMNSPTLGMSEHVSVTRCLFRVVSSYRIEV